MPEWFVIALASVFVTGLLCLFVLASLAALAIGHGLSRLVQRARAWRTEREAAFVAASTVWAICVTPQCGYIERRHRTTAAGLVCTRCGNVPAAAP
ncbi:hypothetical protein [Streptomyces sp. NPDC060198]|uniref:hypothetical protein n=1 Tax=Streptomyces sp. NPDC060198 TaxID=3347070 RepID=UPI00364F4F57